MLNRFDVHNSETLNIQIDRHDQKSYLIELSKDCTKFKSEMFRKFFFKILYSKSC